MPIFDQGYQHWQGPPASGHVIYEMHVGTFTPEETWAAAARELPAVADMGDLSEWLLPSGESRAPSPNGQ